MASSSLGAGNPAARGGGYSLWLVPSSVRVHRQLRSLIERLALTYSTIPFEPHVTVHSGFANIEEAVEVASLAARVSSPFTLRLQSLSCDYSKFYQCVYARVDPSDQLLVLRESANRLAQRTHDVVPHVSLIYSDMPYEERERLIASLHQDVLKGLEFPVDTLCVADCQSPNHADWAIIYSAPLSAGDWTRTGVIAPPGL